MSRTQYLAIKNEQYPSIGLGNGLAPNRRQAIIWANVDPVHWRLYAELGGDLLITMRSGYRATMHIVGTSFQLQNIYVYVNIYKVQAKLIPEIIPSIDMHFQRYQLLIG